MNWQYFDNNHILTHSNFFSPNKNENVRYCCVRHDENDEYVTLSLNVTIDFGYPSLKNRSKGYGTTYIAMLINTVDFIRLKDRMSSSLGLVLIFKEQSCSQHKTKVNVSLDNLTKMPMGLQYTRYINGTATIRLGLYQQSRTIDFSKSFNVQLKLIEFTHDLDNAVGGSDIIDVPSTPEKEASETSFSPFCAIGASLRDGTCFGSEANEQVNVHLITT
jgi:hypothetical protein